MAILMGAVVALLVAPITAHAEEVKVGLVASPTRQVVEADAASGTMFLTNVGDEELKVHAVVFGWVRPTGDQEGAWVQMPNALSVEELTIPPNDSQRAWFEVIDGRETPCSLYRVGWTFPTGVVIDSVGTLLEGSVANDVLVKGTTGSDVDCQSVVVEEEAARTPTASSPLSIPWTLIAGIAGGFLLVGLVYRLGRRRGNAQKTTTFHGFGS